MRADSNIERDWLRRVAGGDEAAFRELFQAYRDKVYGHVLAITRSAESAEDAVQDIFLKLWGMEERLLGIDNLEAYLRRMARNHAYSGFRKLATETLVMEKLQAMERKEPAADDPLLAKDVQRFISGLVDRLTPSQRRVFLLSREQGLSHEEIAQLLGIARNTVKQHMNDALRFLRSEVARVYGPGAAAIFVVYSLSQL